MGRYEKTKRATKDNKLHYLTTTYRKVPKRDTDTYFIAQQGDRLDLLANRFYGSPTLWWFIAHVNHLKGINVPAGTSLRIPAKPGI